MEKSSHNTHLQERRSSRLPENFRPITLEPTTLKIFTSIIRDQIYEFLLKNKYIECHYQKGFTPGMSGTFEHISEMENMINQSRLKRSLVITLIDLRNAFGTVNLHLIQTVLKQSFKHLGYNWKFVYSFPHLHINQGFQHEIYKSFKRCTTR